MALSVEKLLNDARMLVTHLKDHDSLADGIIGNSQFLLNKVEAMKQYQDDITELNEIAKHRPRSTLVLGIAQENRQIRQLQQENRELEASLEEHQSALELIMQKYREHTVKLLQSNQIERALKEKEATEKNSMCHLMDKIDEMAGVMQKAIEVDESSASVDKENLSKLEAENRALREMLEICTTKQNKILPESILKDLELPNDRKQNEETDSDGDSTTLTRPIKIPNEEEGDSDGDSGTLKRSDSSSQVQDDSYKDVDNSKMQEGACVKKKVAENSKNEEVVESKKEDKKETADSKKKTDTKKDARPKDPATSRSGSKSPVVSKSSTDLKKSRLSSSPVKKSSSLTSVTKKETSSASSSSMKKSPSVDSKKDMKAKTTPRTSASTVKK